MIKAVVYTSNTGFTEAYAIILGEKLSLPVFPLDEALKALERNSEIIYLGWLMAGKIKGYSKAKKLFRILCVCGVGMAKSGSQTDDVSKTNNISDIPVFTLQGGFDLNKLSGIYKLMMSTMKKAVTKGFDDKKLRTPDEEEMLDMLQNGKNCVSEDNLSDVIMWYNKK